MIHDKGDYPRHHRIVHERERRPFPSSGLLLYRHERCEAGEIEQYENKERQGVGLVEIGYAGLGIHLGQPL